MSDAHHIDKLLGAEPIESRSLSAATTYLRLDNGRELVVKNVPRQSRNAWQPGKPWTELVALDLLSAIGAPVPRLLAADLDGGWLLYEYVPGDPLTSLMQAQVSSNLFAPLLSGLMDLEAAFVEGREDLTAFATQHSLNNQRDLARSLQPLLNPQAQEAWRELTEMAVQASAMSFGPLDVQPGNALWHDGRFIFIDFATIGLDFIERRLVAYGQLSTPPGRTVLTEQAYHDYEGHFGHEAALRLAFFDLLFWGIVLARLHVMQANPESTTAATLRSSWTEADNMLQPARAMWHRPRIPDPRVQAVIDGLQLLQ